MIKQLTVTAVLVFAVIAYGKGDNPAGGDNVTTDTATIVDNDIFGVPSTATPSGSVGVINEERYIISNNSSADFGNYDYNLRTGGACGSIRIGGSVPNQNYLYIRSQSDGNELPLELGTGQSVALLDFQINEHLAGKTLLKATLHLRNDWNAHDLSGEGEGVHLIAISNDGFDSYTVSGNMDYTYKDRTLLVEWQHDWSDFDEQSAIGVASPHSENYLANTWYSFELNEAQLAVLQDWCDNPTKERGFFIHATDGSNSISTLFGSHINSTTSRRCWIEVTAY